MTTSGAATTTNRSTAVEDLLFGDDYQSIFVPTPEEARRLQSRYRTHCSDAALALHESDVLLVVTGAGFSADSGLATYADVADVPAYRERGWRYKDLCRPMMRMAWPSSLGDSADVGDNEGSSNLEEEKGTFEILEEVDEEEGGCGSVHDGKGNTNDDVMDDMSNPASKNVKGKADKNGRSVTGEEPAQHSEIKSTAGDNIPNHRPSSQSPLSKHDGIDEEIFTEETIEEIHTASSNNISNNEHQFHNTISTSQASSLPSENDVRHPQWFYGFWGQCTNDYRDVKPHEGYQILARWGGHKNEINCTKEQINPKHQDKADMESEANDTPRFEAKETTAKDQNKGNEHSVADKIRLLTKILENQAQLSIAGKQHSVLQQQQQQQHLDDEPYQVTDRAGAFYVFTSNVDAHGYDVFSPHEIRECHGNVELWQCHNRLCGKAAMNTTGTMKTNDINGCVKTTESCKENNSRRLWRLSLSHRFTIDREKMSAPQTKLQTDESHSWKSPAPKRQKSMEYLKELKISENERSDSDAAATDSNESHSNFKQSTVGEGTTDAAEPSDTTAHTPNSSEDATHDHQPNDTTSNTNNTTSNTNNTTEEPARVGQVHGTPRLNPLRYMQTHSAEHYLPIDPAQNWPTCPRCNEAARPAVLMFEDFDWVDNVSQEKRWHWWCVSVLELCQRMSINAKTMDDGISSSNSRDTGHSMHPHFEENDYSSEMEEWNPPSDLHPLSSTSTQSVSTTIITSNETETTTTQTVEKTKTSSMATTITETAKTSTITKTTETTTTSKINTLQLQAKPLKVCILEIGCGYNVPTCRMVSETMVNQIQLRGGDATLVRINPLHPEVDDPDIADFAIPIMSKGLTALKDIDEVYQSLRGTL